MLECVGVPRSAFVQNLTLTDTNDWVVENYETNVPFVYVRRIACMG
jgi:hypothetical protein